MTICLVHPMASCLVLKQKVMGCTAELGGVQLRPQAGPPATSTDTAASWMSLNGHKFDVLELFRMFSAVVYIVFQLFELL